MVFFRCNRTALQDHLTGSAVGLGLCCSGTALLGHYIGSAIGLGFFTAIALHCMVSLHAYTQNWKGIGIHYWKGTLIYYWEDTGM